jgi:hypothetical protein
MKKCERCGASPQGYELLDYCAVCSTDLCGHCIAEGCCGNVPAVSGMEADNEDIEPLAVGGQPSAEGGKS